MLEEQLGEGSFSICRYFLILEVTSQSIFSDYFALNFITWPFFHIYAGFILNLENLENLENGQIYKKSGKTWNSQGTFIIFIQVKENSGKTKYLVYISFSLTIGIVVRKVVALIVASECELNHLVL